MLFAFNLKNLRLLCQETQNTETWTFFEKSACKKEETMLRHETFAESYKKYRQWILLTTTAFITFSAALRFTLESGTELLLLFWNSSDKHSTDFPSPAEINSRRGSFFVQRTKNKEV